MARTAAWVRTIILAPIFFGVVTIAVSAYVVIFASIRPDHPHIERPIRLWARLFLWMAPVDLQFEGRSNIDPDTQYVFVANHLSNFDIPVVIRTIPHRLRYLAKKELYKIPVFSTAMRKVGVVETDRGAGPATHAKINAGVAAARDRGYSLLIFPEATRAVDGELAAFKKGAFRIAIMNGLPVVPVTICGTWEVWRPGAKVFFPGRVRAVIHEPIPVDGLGHKDIEEIRDQAQRVIAKTYEELRNVL